MDDDGNEAQRAAVAARLRAVADRLATDDLDLERLADLDRMVAAAEGRFEGPVPDRTRFARAEPGTVPHPIAGSTSAVYPTFDLDVSGRTLTANIRFGPAWEGPPDLVHGGFLAAGFDMVLSALAHHVVGHAVTRRLQVRYLKPTFWTSQLRYEATAGEPSGRLLDLRGVLYADDQVTMRASAQFATLDPERFADRRA